MKTMKRLMMAFGLALVLMACYATKNKVNTVNTANRKTSVYQMHDFNALDVSGVVKVEFKQGQNYSVEVTESSDPNLLTKVEKRGQTLYIYNEQNSRKSSIKDADYPIVRITAPSLQGIKTSGATSFHTSKLTGNGLSIDASGATKLEAGMLEFNRVKATNTGACKMTASIKAADIDLNCSGASKLVLNMEGKTLKVDNSGASKCDITYVGGSVDFMSSGAGKVDLKLVDCKKLTATNSGATNFTISGNADDTKINASGAAKINTSRLNQY